MKRLTLPLLMLLCLPAFAANLGSLSFEARVTALTAGPDGVLLAVSGNPENQQLHLIRSGQDLTLEASWPLEEKVWAIGLAGDPAQVYLRRADGLYVLPLASLPESGSALPAAEQLLELPAPPAQPEHLRTSLTDRGVLFAGEVGRALVLDSDGNPQATSLPVQARRFGHILTRSSPSPQPTANGICLFPMPAEDGRALMTGCLGEDGQWTSKSPRLGEVTLRSWHRNAAGDWLLLVPGDGTNVFAKATLHLVPDDGPPLSKESDIHLWHGARLRPAPAQGQVSLISIQGLKNAHLTFERVQLKGSRISSRKVQDIKIKKADRFWLAFGDLNGDAIEDTLIRDRDHLLWFAGKPAGGWVKKGQPLPLPEDLDWTAEFLTMGNEGLSQNLGGIGFLAEPQGQGGDLLYGLGKTQKGKDLLLVITP